ncbi:MAG: HEPN domain-containing protein, partial [Candidatus Berkelbacteria bacterium]|nr:HEPN domain-containing protein [Candidatus Berkelbacteria bacterium]
KHFAWSLYLGQLSLEKILKGISVKKGAEPFRTHDLVKLAKLAGIELSAETIAWLNEITTFNIEARYDDYKLSFHLKATEQYAEKWLKIIEELYQSIGKTIND